MFTSSKPAANAGSTRVFWRRTSLAASPADDSVTPILLTITEACVVLRVSRWSLYQLIRSRKLATVQIGRRRLIPRDALQALIERLGDEGLL
jgi:excisionase family DNA binding protein